VHHRTGFVRGVWKHVCRSLDDNELGLDAVRLERRVHGLAGIQVNNHIGVAMNEHRRRIVGRDMQYR